MEFRELVIKNRSFRGYDESYSFTREQLLSLVDLTRFAASSVNLQPLKYHVAWEREETEKILSMTKWARALPQIKLPRAGMHPTGFIIICQDTSLSADLVRFRRDVGIAAQTILLGAAEQGLGGCMIGNYVPEQVKSEMGFADNLEPVLIVALGKPAEQIVLTELKDGESHNYYRDENDVHYVPKRRLEDIVF